MLSDIVSLSSILSSLFAEVPDSLKVLLSCYLHSVTFLTVVCLQMTEPCPGCFGLYSYPGLQAYFTTTMNPACQAHYESEGLAPLPVARHRHKIDCASIPFTTPDLYGARDDYALAGLDMVCRDEAGGHGQDGEGRFGGYGEGNDNEDNEDNKDNEDKPKEFGYEANPPNQGSNLLSLSDNKDNIPPPRHHPQTTAAPLDQASRSTCS